MFESACRGSALMLLRPQGCASRARDSVTWIVDWPVVEGEEGKLGLAWQRGCVDGVAAVMLRRPASVAAAVDGAGVRCREWRVGKRYR